MGRKKKIEAIMKEKNIETIQTNESSAEKINESEKSLIAVQEKMIQELKDQIADLKSQSSREHDQQEIDISNKMIATRTENKAIKEQIDRQREYDNVPVTGKFLNQRAPGNPAKLLYQKHLGDPEKWWVFNHGKTYTIPRGFADQINEYYHTPMFIQKEGAIDEDAGDGNLSAIAMVDTSNKKYAFVPVNF